MPVELRWDGKYDADGNRKPPLKISLPFQTVETVNESVQDRQKNLFASAGQVEWRNRLIWGDKKYVLPSLLDEYAGKVNLVYIDPPYKKEANFSFQVEIEDEEFIKEPSIIEQKAYRDTWGKGLDRYLRWFYEATITLRDLLTQDGTMYVHLDWQVGHYAKAILDEIFGYENFINEIIWRRTAAHNDPGRFGNIHDVIFFYRKGQSYKWNPQYISHSEESISSTFSYAEGPKNKIIKLKRGEAAPAGY